MNAPSMSKWQHTTDPLHVRRLGKTGEELAELAAVVSRCLIQGLDEVDPSSGKTNRQRLIDETADVRAQLNCNDRAFGLPAEEMAARIAKKEGWMAEWEAHYGTNPPIAPLAEAPKAVADERRAHRSSLIRAAASVTELRTWGQAHTANQSAALDEKTRQLAQSLKEAYDALPAIPLPAQEALERDAGRYRWLRDVGDATWRPFGLRDGCSADLADAAIDQAIDAALSQQKGQR